MSTDDAAQTPEFVTHRTAASERVAAGLVGLAVLTAVAGLLSLFTVLPVTATAGGVTVATLFGLSLLVLGVGILGFGAASATGAVATDPDHTGGLLAAVLYGLVWLVTGGLVAAQGLGLSTLWPVVALIFGAGAGALALLVREDVGTTVPAGAFLLLGGLVVSGLVGPGWEWSPEAFSVTLTPAVAVPALTIVGGVLGGWTAARAYAGFGANGRQKGAYALVGANAVGMLLLPGAIVALIVAKGAARLFQGLEIGLFWGNWTWFYVPGLEEYVIFEGPILWFYWPFVMEGASLGPTANGVLPAILGTVWVVAGAIIFAVPLGVGAAVFLTEYAEQGRFTGLVEVSTNGLWSTPSIVYGLFGLAFLVPRIGNQSTLITGQLVLGFMLLPLVIITSRESLKSVPDEYRDASAALGVSKWQTIRSVVLPAAIPGVITGIILGVGRIAGETAPILLVMVSNPFPQRAVGVVQGGFSFTGQFPFVSLPAIDLVQSSTALPYQLFAIITAGVGETQAFGWATALVLLLVVMGFYAVGVGSRIYFRRKLNQ
ncbi:phosphate ABC transporter permease PstA [Halomicrobium urmianum]|uniref:phosphate ABC transporter permease PstA n=1 Tax=Halomicrobium urmianum TaxID=1586233 RepID=UPI001CD9A82E|nr:phosphate ABC transporter permease PstA [Halomicrobium urmianum]